MSVVTWRQGISPWTIWWSSLSNRPSMWSLIWRLPCLNPHMHSDWPDLFLHPNKPGPKVPSTSDALGPTPAYPLSLRKLPTHLGKHNVQTTKNLPQAISWSLPSMSKTLWNSTQTAFYSHLRFPTGHLRRMHRRAHCQRCLRELGHSGSCGHLQSAQKVGCDRVIGKTTLEELQSQNRKWKTLKQLYIQ